MIPRFRLVLLLALGAAAAGACDQVPLLAPTGATLTLTASQMTLGANETAEITATVIEDSGTPVHNGTLVTFTTTAGQLDLREARTHNGIARVHLSANGTSGIAIVNAFSGGATTSGTAGGDGAATLSGSLEIKLGAAAASRITLSAEPTALPATGGTVKLVATVTDENSRSLVGVTVRFSASAGSLSASSAVTDDMGVATVSLTTSVEADVTARVGTADDAELTVTVQGLTGLSVAPPTTAPTAGDPTQLKVTAIGDAAVRNVTLEFGDGTSTFLGTVPAGTAAGVSVPHIYGSAGTYTATASGVDVNGRTVTGSTPVVVKARAPLTLTLTLPSTPTKNTTQAFSVTVSDGSGSIPPVASVTWSWGDGTSTTTNSLSTSHVYLNNTTYTIQVTVRTSDGRTGTATAQIKVN